MAQRKKDAAGTPIPFTCWNKKFETEDFGYVHRRGSVHKGSVFAKPLYDDGDISLWLEHVTNHRDDPTAKLYWLMYYDKNGNPLLGASSVLGPDEVAEIGKQIVRKFLP